MSLTSGFVSDILFYYIQSKTRKLGNLGRSVLEADPDLIIAKARGDKSFNRDSEAKHFLTQIKATPEQHIAPNYRTAVSPIMSGTGFALPRGIADDRPSIDFKRKV